jgi:hypothetical protein
MKRMSIVFVLVLAFSALFILPLWQDDAMAQNSGNGCKLQGTWIGETPYPLPGNPDFVLKFFSTYQGTGDTEGTDVLEWINPLPDPGTTWANPHGVWTKSGPNRYKYTLLGFITDAATGNVLVIARHVGTKTLTDCNTMEVTSTVEYLAPDGTPLMCAPTNATLHRVVQQKGCQAP